MEPCPGQLLVLTGRVVAATAAVLIATGGASVVMPVASAQDLASSAGVPAVTLPPEVQSSLGSAFAVGAAVFLPIYYFIWCPLAIAGGSVDQNSGACTF